MSKARKIPDAERTATMLDLLHLRYQCVNGISHVVVEEVAPGTGWGQRWADAVVLSVWQSNGLTLDGFEIKASRSDLLRELGDLEKHQAVARYCDSWTLLVWDENILTDAIPDDWGITVTVERETGRELKVVRRPAKRTPEPWPRSFVCSLVRNAYQQAPGAAFVARVAAEAALSAEQAAVERTKRSAIAVLSRALYGSDSWRQPRASLELDALLATAAERLQQLPLTHAGAV